VEKTKMEFRRILGWCPMEGDIHGTHSHGAGVDRGNGPQDGHWDDENSNNRWDRNGVPLFQNQSFSFTDQISNATGLTGVALAVYIVVSEGSRIIPARNIIPVP